jgi:N-acetylneuraminic acid mutarotase
MKRKLQTEKITRKFQTWRCILSYSSALLISVQAFPQGENWRLISEVPVPRHDVASCVVDGKIYVIGGGSHDYAPGDTFFDLVSRFDPETGVWENLDSLPESRVGAYACHINNRIYLFGGTKDWSSPNSATVYIYDIDKDEWTSGTDMPGGIAFAGGCVYDNKVYLAGGLKEGCTNWIPTNSVLRYDPAGDIWDTLANMNVAISFPSVYLAGSKIYSFGGSKTPEGIVYDVLQEYDPALNVWTNKNPMPTKLCLHRCISFNDRIWLMSGTTANSDPINDSVYIYEPATDSWSNSAAADVPSVDFWYPSLVTHDKTVYLLCGYIYTNHPADVPEVIAFDFPVARLQNDTALSGESFEILFYEDGDIYVTSSGTPADITSIQQADDQPKSGTAGQTITVQVDTPGSYWIYGIASDGRLDRGYSSLNIIPTPVKKEIIQGFRIYPNPTRDYIKVELSAAGDISLFDILGNEITSLSYVSGITTIPVSDLSRGVYFLKVRYGKDFRTEIVLVE